MKTKKQQLIDAYGLTKQEVAFLDLHYTNTWFNHREPNMYIMEARRSLAEHYCPECGRKITEWEWEDYRLCSRCHEAFGD